MAKKKQEPRFAPTLPGEAFEAISQAATACGLSIKQACEKCGVQFSTVYRWKNNRRTYDIAQFHQVMNFLDSILKLAKKRVKK